MGKIFGGKYLDFVNPICILIVRNPPKGSTIWNFMQECRPIIIKHLSWHIGNGGKAFFWYGSWNGLSRLVELEGV